MLAQHVLMDNGAIQIILDVGSLRFLELPKVLCRRQISDEERSHDTLDASIFPGHVHRSTKGEVHDLNSVQSGHPRFMS
jgi:hypothetical protein